MNITTIEIALLDCRHFLPAPVTADLLHFQNKRTYFSTLASFHNWPYFGSCQRLSTIIKSRILKKKKLNRVNNNSFFDCVKRRKKTWLYTMTRWLHNPVTIFRRLITIAPCGPSHCVGLLILLLLCFIDSEHEPHLYEVKNRNRFLSNFAIPVGLGVVYILHAKMFTLIIYAPCFGSIKFHNGQFAEKNRTLTSTAKPQISLTNVT